MTKLDRRMFLRGAATCVALPVFQSALSDKAFAQQQARRRLVLIYNPNGFMSSGGFMMDHITNELKEHYDDLRLIGGLNNPNKASYDDGLFHCSHSACSASFMSAIPLTKISGGYLRPKTFDQMIAEKISAGLPSQSIGMTVIKLRPYVHFTYGTFSYIKENVPLEMTADLTSVFRRLTAGGERSPAVIMRDEQLRAERKSVLDRVLPEIRSLQATLGAKADKEKLDQYLTGLQDVERRLSPGATMPRGGTCDTGALKAQVDANGQSFPLRQALVYELAATLMHCDLTRSISIHMGENDYNFSGLGGITGAANWHGASHAGDRTNEKKIEAYVAKGFAGFLAQLKKRDDGGASLLRRSAILYMSDMAGTADPHSPNGMSMLLAGQGDGLYARGSNPAALRRLSLGGSIFDLWFTMLKDWGVDATAYGQGSKYRGELRA